MLVTWCKTTKKEQWYAQEKGCRHAWKLSKIPSLVISESENSWILNIGCLRSRNSQLPGLKALIILENPWCDNMWCFSPKQAMNGLRRAADLISHGDTIERCIRSTGTWKLLNEQVNTRSNSFELSISNTFPIIAGDARMCFAVYRCGWPP